MSDPLSDLIVEPAKSARSTCKSCKDSIEKGGLRVGDQISKGDYKMTKWYHSACYFGNNFDAGKCRNDRRKGDKQVTTDNMSDIPGFDDLTSEQQSAIESDIKKEKANAVPSTPKKSTQKKSRKRKLPDDDDVEEMTKGRPLSTRTLKVRLLRRGLPSTGSKAELRARLYAALKKERKRSKQEEKESSEGEDPSETDVAKARKLAETLKTNTNKLLSQMLRDNNQKVSGTKADLTARVADCILFGCIPECPKCGRSIGLKVTYTEANHKGQGKWVHTGAYDDDGVFEKCGFKATNVKRYPWTDMKWT